VWQKARTLTRQVYERSDKGVFSRDFVLRDQVRRAAISVMANIAEGFERGGDNEFRQFLAVAKGSCGELRSHLWVARDVGYLTSEEPLALNDRAEEISRMVAGLMRHLGESPLRGSKYK